MAVSTTEVVLLSLITIDVNFKVNIKNWTRWGCFPGLSGLFHLEKYIVTIHLWNHKNNHRTVVLKQTPTLVNVMEGSHTNNCIAHPYYNCHWLLCVIMKGKQVSVHNISGTLFVLKWCVLITCSFRLMQIKTTLSKVFRHWFPKINVDCYGNILKMVRNMIVIFWLKFVQMYGSWSKVS